MSTLTKVGPGALMRAEIREQPARWLDLVQNESEALQEAGDLLRRRPDAPSVFVARGSSDHAAIYGQYLIQMRLDRPAFLSTPAVFSLTSANTLPTDAIVIAISQSGMSPDLLAVLERATLRGATTITLTNDPSSSMASMADIPVHLCAGLEQSVAATKTYTTELLALAGIVAYASGDGAGFSDGVADLSERVERRIDEFQPLASALAGRLQNADRLMVVGRALSMSTAKEAALKFMETCRIAASGWSASDAQHGPIGQLEPGVPLILTGLSGVGGGSVQSIGSAGAQLGADVIVTEFLNGLGDLAPVAEIVAFQMIACELSLLRGLDPDRPQGLAKVTMTT